MATPVSSPAGQATVRGDELRVAMDAEFPTAMHAQLWASQTAGAAAFDLTLVSTVEDPHVHVIAGQFAEWRPKPPAAPVEILIQRGISVGGALVEDGLKRNERACTLALRNRIDRQSFVSQCDEALLAGLLESALVGFLDRLAFVQLVVLRSHDELVGAMRSVLSEAIPAVRRYEPLKRKLSTTRDDLVGHLESCEQSLASAELSDSDVRAIAERIVGSIDDAPAAGLIGLTFGERGAPLALLSDLCSALRADRGMAAGLPRPTRKADASADASSATESRNRHDSRNAAQHDWEDEIDVRIGRVCRADVALELFLRLLYLAVAGGRRPLAVPGSMAELVGQVRAMVATSASPTDSGHPIERALDRADEAHAARNRVVHDMWLPGFPEPTEAAVRTDLRSLLSHDRPDGDATRHTLDGIEAVHDQLVAATQAIADQLGRLGHGPPPLAPPRRTTP